MLKDMNYFRVIVLGDRIHAGASYVYVYDFGVASICCNSCGSTLHSITIFSVFSYILSADSSTVIIALLKNKLQRVFVLLIRNEIKYNIMCVKVKCYI